MSEAADEEETPQLFDDAIAARAQAFTELIVSLAEITDEELRKEGVEMLRALRLSFKAPRGQVVPIKMGQ